MESQRSRNLCCCSQSTLHLSATILILSWILPNSSFGQLTSSTTRANEPLSTSLSTSTLPSSSFSSTSLSPATTVKPSPAAMSTQASSAGSHKAYYYYILIVAVAAIFFCGLVMWFSRRNKRKALLMRRQSQRALARDVEGWRTRFRATAGAQEVRIEGLDERGEAPPPYAPGSKPPSISSGHVDERDADGSGDVGGVVELRRLTGERGEELPEYDEARSDTEQVIRDVTRPTMVHTVSERFETTRRLESDTRSVS